MNSFEFIPDKPLLMGRVLNASSPGLKSCEANIYFDVDLNSSSFKEDINYGRELLY
jgi:hypothetical protein